MNRWHRMKSELNGMSMEEVVELQLASECVKWWREVDKEPEKEIQELLYFFEFETMDGYKKRKIRR